MTQARSAHLSRARLAAVAAAVVIAAHGLAHLMGVALLWKLGEPGKLRYADVVPAAGSTAGCNGIQPIISAWPDRYCAGKHPVIGGRCPARSTPSSSSIMPEFSPGPAATRPAPTRNDIFQRRRTQTAAD
jgi:hypothetical protein